MNEEADNGRDQMEGGEQRNLAQERADAGKSCTPWCVGHEVSKHGLILHQRNYSLIKANQVRNKKIKKERDLVVQELKPFEKGFSTYLKVLRVHNTSALKSNEEEKIEEESSPVKEKYQYHEMGDHTGIIRVSLHSSKINPLPLPEIGSVVYIQNAKTLLYEKRLLLSVDSWGLFRVVEDHKIDDVNEENDVSKNEILREGGNDGRPQRRRGGRGSRGKRRGGRRGDRRGPGPRRGGREGDSNEAGREEDMTVQRE